VVRLNTCFDSSEGATFRLQAVYAIGDGGASLGPV